jgi:hypothetical protein
LVAFALLALAAPARADEQGEVEKVRAAYLAQRYDEAETKLHEMLDPKHPTVHDPALVTQARMYLAAVLLAKKHPEAANPVLERVILDDPSYEPDPLGFPTEVIDTFIDTRGKLRERLNAEALERARKELERKQREEAERLREAEHLATLERLAGEEKLTETHSRWLALVPMGVGQFQNGDRALGWFFLATEGACLAATAITVPVYLTDLQYRSDAYRAGDLVRAQEYIDRASTVRDVDLGFAAAFGVLAIAGVVQAQATFVPESVELRKRPVPSAFALPTLAPASEGRGASVGVIGRF